MALHALKKKYTDFFADVNGTCENIKMLSFVFIG
jgi:hypothetical protein